jgi:hypothetical protein
VEVVAMLKRTVWWSCAVWLSLASAASAGIVFEQPPNLGGGIGSDTAFYEIIGSPEVWQLVADNVQVSESAEIRQISWWGFYGGNFDGTSDPPVGDEYMRVRLYAPRQSDGLPDNSAILYEESILNASRMATGRVIFGGSPEFRYEADLGTAFLLQANTLYWFEIVQLGDVDSHYRWSYGTGIVLGRANSNPIVPDWFFSPGSFAFQLSTIPEPQNAALVGVVSLVLARRRRWRSSPC